MRVLDLVVHRGESVDYLAEGMEYVSNTSFSLLRLLPHALAAALSELGETRGTAEHELEVARAKGEALQRLEHDRNALMESYAGMVSETLEDLAPEERHRIYKLLRLGVRFRPD